MLLYAFIKSEKWMGNSNFAFKTVAYTYASSERKIRFFKNSFLFYFLTINSVDHGKAELFDLNAASKKTISCSKFKKIIKKLKITSIYFKQRHFS
jgi:hypothetical protein